jgi:hypothetical protein
MVQNVHFIRKGQARGENCKETSLSGFTLAQQQQQQQKRGEKQIYRNIKTVIEEALKNSFHNKRWNETSRTRDRKISLSVSPSLSLFLSLARARARDTSRGAAPLVCDATFRSPVRST